MYYIKMKIVIVIAKPCNIVVYKKGLPSGFEGSIEAWEQIWT